MIDIRTRPWICLEYACSTSRRARGVIPTYRRRSPGRSSTSKCVWLLSLEDTKPIRIRRPMKTSQNLTGSQRALLEVASVSVRMAEFISMQYTIRNSEDVPGGK